jgi:hypothetical protein
LKSANCFVKFLHREVEHQINQHSGWKMQRVNAEMQKWWGLFFFIFRGVALFADDGTTRDDTTQQEEAIGLFVDKI